MNIVTSVSHQTIERLTNRPQKPLNHFKELYFKIFLNEWFDIVS